MTDDNSETEIADDTAAESEVHSGDGDTPSASGSDRQRLIAFVLLPAVLLLLGALAGFLKWQSESARADQIAARDSVAAARDATTAVLSYSAGNVDTELNAARGRLTGSFLDSYTKLINDVVIPGAKQKKITAVAQVPAAASVSANPTHAVALVFVNQATTIGNDIPTNTTSTVRVTLDKIQDRWLVSAFDPV